MELNHLRYFFEVAKAGSFTAAAKNLRVSQPSLSKTVALLEEREGVKLLERSKSGVTMTALGTRVYLECEKMFGTLQEVKNICAGTTEVCQGYMRLGASDHIASYLLPEQITRMHKLHPLVVPSVFVGTPNDIVQMIQRRELEFGLFFTKIQSPLISYRSLRTVAMAAVHHPKFGAEKFRGKKSSEMELVRNYIGSIKQDYKQYPAQEILDALESPPEIQFETNSQEMQKRLCLEGAGLAILARFMVEEEIKKGRLVEMPLPKAEATATLQLATRKNHALSLNAKTFLETLTEEKFR